MTITTLLMVLGGLVVCLAVAAFPEAVGSVPRAIVGAGVIIMAGLFHVADQIRGSR